MSYNGRSIADLQKLIQRAESIRNDRLKQKLTAEMQRTVTEFCDNLLSEEQKLAGIENYVAGKQKLPSEQNGKTGKGQSEKSAKKRTHLKQGVKSRNERETVKATRSSNPSKQNSKLYRQKFFILTQVTVQTQSRGSSQSRRHPNSLRERVGSTATKNRQAAQSP